MSANPPTDAVRPPAAALAVDQSIAKPVSIAPGLRKDSEANRDVFATLVVVALIVLLMEITSRYVPDYIMPSPAAVLKATRELFFSDAWHVAVTLLRLTVAVGFA